MGWTQAQVALARSSGLSRALHAARWDIKLLSEQCRIIKPVAALYQRQGGKERDRNFANTQNRG